MPDYSHADLLAAIDKFQRGVEAEMYEHYQPTLLLAYLDTLRAILDLCAPWHPKDPERDRIYPHEVLPVVADALRKVGAL